MDGSLTASDVALLNNDGMGGWNGMIWLFAILALMGGGFGGFGNNFANAIGYENLATSNEVQRGFDNQNLQAQTRDILAAVNNATLENINVAKDIEGMILNQIGEVKVGQASIQGQMNECCCNMRLQMANDTASINATTVAQTQKILDALCQNKIESLQNQVNNLTLQNALSGVVKYPATTAFSVPSTIFTNGTAT